MTLTFLVPALAHTRFGMWLKSGLAATPVRFDALSSGPMNGDRVQATVAKRERSLRTRVNALSASSCP